MYDKIEIGGSYLKLRWRIIGLLLVLLATSFQFHGTGVIASGSASTEVQPAYAKKAMNRGIHNLPRGKFLVHLKDQYSRNDVREIFKSLNGYNVDRHHVIPLYAMRELPFYYLYLNILSGGLDEERYYHNYTYYENINSFSIDLSIGELSQILMNPMVAFVEENKMLEQSSTNSSDSQFIHQFQQSFQSIHTTKKGNQPIKVAIFDSGESNYSDLKTVIKAPLTEFYSYEVFDSSGAGYTSSVLEGLNWAAQNGMDVIIMNFAHNSFSESLSAAIESLKAANITVLGMDGKRFNPGRLATLDAQLVPFDEFVTHDLTNKTLRLSSISDVDYFKIELKTPEQVDFHVTEGDGVIENDLGHVLCYLAENEACVLELAAGDYYLRVEYDPFKLKQQMGDNNFKSVPYEIVVYINHIVYGYEIDGVEYILNDGD